MTAVAQSVQTVELTFAELWTKYAKWAEVHLPKTWGPVRKAHGKHLVGFFGGLPWSGLTHSKTDEYIAWRREQTTVRKKPPTNATLNNEIVSAKACITWGLTGAPAGQNPIGGVSPLDGYPHLPVRNVRDFSIDEGDFLRLLEHARPLLRLMLVFAVETGMRRNEFRLLQWAEIDRRRNVVKLAPERTKTGKARTIPLSQTAQEVLKAVPRFAGDKWVFESPFNPGTPVSKTALHNWFTKARERSGVKGPDGQEVWVHSVRKTFGTKRAMGGMPVYMLMEIMGHSSYDVHSTYVKMSPDYDEQVRSFMNGRRPPLASVPKEAEPVQDLALLRFVKCDTD